VTIPCIDADLEAPAMLGFEKMLFSEQSRVASSVPQKRGPKAEGDEDDEALEIFR
jgi:hypothetical protein